MKDKVLKQQRQIDKYNESLEKMALSMKALDAKA